MSREQTLRTTRSTAKEKSTFKKKGVEKRIDRRKLFETFTKKEGPKKPIILKPQTTKKEFQKAGKEDVFSKLRKISGESDLKEGIKKPFPKRTIKKRKPVKRPKSRKHTPQISLIRSFRIGFSHPVWPKPPAPRVVGFKLSTKIRRALTTGAITS